MKLWLIRHAKSDWHSGAENDFDRPLNARGRRDGPRMAAWLAAQPGAATWIWSSDALRARATAEYVADGFAAAQPDIVEQHTLYNAAPETILSVIQGTPADVTTAAVVAHNPGITHLLNLLTGESVTGNVPTLGVARLDVPAPWSELAFGRATLEVFTSPKRLDP